MLNLDQLMEFFRMMFGIESPNQQRLYVRVEDERQTFQRNIARQQTRDR